LDCITPVRFGVGGAEKRATECGGSISDQLTVFSRGAFVITTNVYFIGAAYNSHFLIIYKPSTLIISPWTFSTQLGASTAWFCLSQYAIPFCTLSLPQKKVVSVNSLESPEKRQEVIEIEDGKVVEVWAVADPVLQFLEKLSLEEHSCQIFAIEEEGEKEERVAPDMAHLRVVPAVINGIGEEKVLLDSGSQIVSMTKKVATANKVSWDPSLSIQMQSTNESLSRTCRLARNVPFTLGGVTVLLQVRVMDAVPYTVLLVRPFDTITESRIVNDKEGNQTVYITCLNTGTKVAIPTYKRGELPQKVENLANFW